MNVRLLYTFGEGGGAIKVYKSLSTSTRVPEEPWLMKLFTTPPSILILVTWVHRMQAWPSANSARRLAFESESESYSVQPASLAAGDYYRTCGPIESLFLLSPARILDGKAQLYSFQLSYSYCMGFHLFSRE